MNKNSKISEIFDKWFPGLFIADNKFNILIKFQLDNNEITGTPFGIENIEESGNYIFIKLNNTSGEYQHRYISFRLVLTLSGVDGDIISAQGTMIMSRDYGLSDSACEFIYSKNIDILYEIWNGVESYKNKQTIMRKYLIKQIQLA